MSMLSKFGLTVFEIMNEIHITVGTGIVGFAFLLQQNLRKNQLVRTLSIFGLTAACLIYVFCNTELPHIVIIDGEPRQATKKQIVVISGCDSGLGYSLACHTCDLGFTVFGGFLNLQSPGSLDIQEKYKGNCVQVRLDLTNKESIKLAVENLRQLLDNDHELYALVNNAGVMVFGEFEWLTDDLIMDQINVNLTGTVRLSNALIPLLRKSKGRLINVTSHCAHACLPGLSIYGATKAGISAFSDGLRVELAKYGVRVIQMIPGSFLLQSNILAKHFENVQQMFTNFSHEQHEFYDDYFQRYHEYLLKIPVQAELNKLVNDELYRNFEDALFNQSPKALYKTEPLRYRIYHILFRLAPVSLRDYFVERFVQMPAYHAEIKFFTYGFEPNLNAIQNLACYQCYGNSSNNSQLCNQRLFKLARPEERLNFTFICPPYQQTYCFKQVKYYMNFTETSRGCCTGNDLNDQEMKPGCAWKLSEKSSKNQPYQIDFCLCNTNFCNQTTMLKQIKFQTILIQILFTLIKLFE